MSSVAVSAAASLFLKNFDTLCLGKAAVKSGCNLGAARLPEGYFGRFVDFKMRHYAIPPISSRLISSRLGKNIEVRLYCGGRFSQILVCEQHIADADPKQLPRTHPKLLAPYLSRLHLNSRPISARRALLSFLC
jgi:hypothetical protein